MAELLVSIVLKQLGSMTLDQFQREFTLLWNVREDAQQLSSTFTKIQAVLEDAEEMQVTNKSVKAWLQDLKDLAYDTDDLLDEWITKALVSQVRNGGGSVSFSQMKKVCQTYLTPPCFCFNPVPLRYNMGYRMKKIRERLDKIAIDKERYQLTETTATRRRIDENPKRSRTSSQVDASEIVGRDVEKKEIISKLVRESNQQLEIGPHHTIPIISIFGMGGSGKTTLAQIIYNDDKVITHFQMRIWVCVSQPFDQDKIAKAIVKAVDGNASFRDGIEWQELHQQLTNSLKGKLYLLVLDDVWTDKETDWNDLKLSFNHGSQGSRIVVTTRKESVAKMRGTTYSHPLGMLSDENCWRLLSHIALDGRTEEDCAKLEEVGKKIAKKCQGLPLSAKTIGGLLRNKKPLEQEWERVLESCMWDLPEVKQDILNGAVLLSYYDLPPHLKRCFSFCAIFPEDYKIKKDTLIKLWMAQGFLSNTSTTGKAPELIGDEYFEELAMRAFFQDFKRDDDGNNIIWCKMHDVVHEFAQFLTKDESYAVTMEINHGDGQNFNFHKARHLRLQLALDHRSTKPVPSVIYEAKKLRTLLLSSSKVEISMSDLFHCLTCLRALHLGTEDIKELPMEVGNLMHLRYLDLSDQSELKELPETICDLYNLQTLDLYQCVKLQKLPQGIRQLTQLRHLGIKKTPQLKYLPQGIGRLSSLHTLCKFIVGNNGFSGVGMGCEIEELKDLNNLQGSLHIEDLGKVANKNEASMANLKKKQHLRHLELWFGGGYYEEDDMVKESMEGVLEALEPPSYLETLRICEYIGTKLPNWMNQVLLSNLVILCLNNFQNCKQLPSSLGKLPSFKEIEISGWKEVIYMNFEFFGLNNTGGAVTCTASDDGEKKVLFPKLEKISIYDMPSLEEWNLGIQEESGETNITFMPCLHTLHLHYCSSMNALVHNSTVPPLRQLVIKNCPKLASSSLSLPQDLEELRIEEKTGDIRILESLPPINNIKSLTLNGGYVSYVRSLPKGLNNLTMLQTLEIELWGYITSLPEDLQHLTTLQKLSIDSCPNLEKRCQKEVGEEWNKISHIPNIKINGRKIQ
ncbi:PREDICTED: disease resistance protein RGA2-like [Nelumbo nucifera]|uniref:Disease resistance protein RGA3 n=2 Tax=Nelumbo nucifera TaxID=4432 RepID=A0A822YMD7_NELNU|nr:PREDICTED: disease resistance protein RGA2-like [Nelumbo nucifera]DAD32469.1 TPA_asm: hypothetical protein HUJ06_011320 [Nelumbo nucifera]